MYTLSKWCHFWLIHDKTVNPLFCHELTQKHSLYTGLSGWSVLRKTLFSTVSKWSVLITVENSADYALGTHLILAVLKSGSKRCHILMILVNL